MPGYRRKLLPLCIAASLLSGLSLESAAIGVGEIKTQSFLGAPFLAEVPLSHLGDLSADQIKVQLGSQDDYSALGVDYTYLHSQLKIEPVVKNGQGYVRISTREPIAEPYLNFVLTLRWPQGQLVREFTVLLDLPAASTAIATSSAPDARADSAMASQADQSAPVVPHRRQRPRAAITPAAAAVTPAPAASPATEGSYVIQRGDSLWRIANRVRPAQVSVEQMMDAIHTANPGAFVNGDPSRLKEAATLVLPDAQQVAGTAGHMAASATPVARADAEAAGKAVGGGDAPAVTQLAEENVALKAQVSDLTANVATLSQNLVQSEQRLHQLESQLNDLIRQMQQQRSTIATLSGSVESAAAPMAQSSGSVINQVNAAELKGVAKAHTPWWVHMLYWLGIGSAVTWAVREHFWPQRRLALAGGVANPVYEGKDESVSRTPMSRAAAPAGINTVADAAELTLDLDELPIADANRSRAENSAGEPAPHLLNSGEEAVDASISAGVFVAFGRYDEAERLLRDALRREPGRLDLKLQLLDVLMQMDQPGAFDDLADEVEREAPTPEILAELAVLRDSYRSRH